MKDMNMFHNSSPKKSINGISVAIVMIGMVLLAVLIYFQPIAPWMVVVLLIEWIVTWISGFG